jgi:hypothetical protein
VEVGVGVVVVGEWRVGVSGFGVEWEGRDEWRLECVVGVSGWSVWLEWSGCFVFVSGEWVGVGGWSVWWSVWLECGKGVVGWSGWSEWLECGKGVVGVGGWSEWVGGGK